MLHTLARRLVSLPLLLLAVSLVLFLISQVIPANPVSLVVGDSAPVEVKDAIRVRLGLDQPLHVQYWNYLVRLAQGDLGQSIRFGVPVSQLVVSAFPATLQLVVGGGVIAVLIAFPLGLLAGARRDSWIDVVSRGFAIFGMATPGFFMAIIFVLVFGFYLGWFPISGRGEPPDLHHMVLPALVLGLRYAGNTTRLLRASMIEALNQDYIKAAWARGLSERVVVVKYAFRNALIPALTDLGVSLADMLGTVILVETIFAWPGIGRMVFLGIMWNDFPILSGAIVTLVAYAVAINMLVDAVYGAIDPRIRVS